MKDAWRDNPLFDQGKIELVPITWIWKYRGTDPSKTIDLGTVEVDLDGLWREMMVNGMTEPFIMRVGVKNKKFRLETGNHRIQLLKNNNVDIVPLIVQIRDICGPEAEDVMTTATHNFDWGDEILIFDTTSQYLKPSEVFRSLKK